MEATTLRCRARLALAHTIAVVWITGELTYQAGKACGAAIHRLNQWMAARAVAAATKADAADLQLQAVIVGWEEACAAGQWQEPEPVEPLCPGAWWDLIDPGSAAEADPEPPLRWAA